VAAGTLFRRTLPSQPAVSRLRPLRRNTRAATLYGAEPLEGRLLLAAYNVTNLLDTGAGSLRQAVLSANASAGSDTIKFAAGLSGTIVLKSSSLLITDDVTITGPGASLLTVSGNKARRILNINPSVTAAITGLTLRDGSADFGGAILNEGLLTVSNSTFLANKAVIGREGGEGAGIHNSEGAELTVINCAFQGNIAEYRGGGILNLGTLSVTNSSFSGNRGDGGEGGGISNLALLTVTGSTFTLNSASTGGGLANIGLLTLTNSTFFRNSAQISGGGLCHYGTITITNNTFAENSAAIRGGGVWGFDVYPFGFHIANTIVANNTAPDSPDIDATFTSEGGNLVGQTEPSDWWLENDLIGTAEAPVDPKLGPLADNGGPTQTMALLPGSPAVNAGDDALADAVGLTTDQRGLPRVAGSAVDIGAYESLEQTGPLVVRGTDGDDTIILTDDATSLTYSVNDATPVTLSRLFITSLSIDGNGGNDTVIFNGTADGSTSMIELMANLTIASDANGRALLAGPGAALTFGVSQHLAWLDLSGNAIASLAPGGNKLLTLDSLSIGPDATLDLGNGDLLAPGSDLPATFDLITSARNAETRWGGTGITSSTAMNDATNKTGLALGLRDSGGVFVKYTWNGDANLDGVVNADDYFLIDKGFISQPGGYGNGDFNYDGVVNADDYFLIDFAFLGQTGPLASGESVQTPTAADIVVARQPLQAKATDPTILAQVFSTSPVL